MQNIKCLACRMFPINANHWGEKHSANKTQSLDPGCKAAGPSCLIAVRILASPGVCLDLEEGLGQQLSVLCGPDCKQSGHAAEGQLRQSRLGVDRKENRGPLRVIYTNGGKQPPGDHPALPDDEDGFTL